ncbi:MAG: TIGR00266 family protein [Clostridiales bacterium]|nr:TIGR00266 family protein [Clostridiales bacterium]
MQYEIKGNQLPVVVCTLEQGESMITERGAMSWMTSNMKMETQAGGIGKAVGRLFSGEAMFQNKYTAEGGQGSIAFASSFPGEIRALQISPGNNIVCQKSAFLAAETGVELSVYFRKKFGAGLFGGEGFIMQKLSGTGTAFVEIDGSLVDYFLEPGETMLLDTGYLAMMEETVQMDIEMVHGMKNIFLGGEGLFNTKVTGPGRVWIQTMPLSSVANLIGTFFPGR